MAEESVALRKFACPACGAEAHWNAAQQALVCPYCGTQSPAELAADGRTIRENDLALALRQLGADRRGWQSDRRAVRCQSCNAISVFESSRVGQRCDFCGSPALLAVTDTAAPIKPESVLHFKLAEGETRDALRQWYRTRWFAPNRLKSKALTDQVKGVYLPYWTFDAQVSADWTAEAGYHYWENETYYDSQGKAQSRRVQKTRWVPASGHVDHFFDDELVAASKGVPGDLLRQLEPFPTKELRPYDPGYLSGWLVEQYQLDLIGAARHAREVMEDKMESLCASQVPGDTHRNLRMRADYSAQTFKHVLLPVWLATFTYGAKSYQVLMNGYTGKVAGKYPLSFWKICFLVLAILAAGFVVFALAQAR